LNFFECIVSFEVFIFVIEEKEIFKEDNVICGSVGQDFIDGLSEVKIESLKIP
jgi:hypothetical protein